MYVYGKNVAHELIDTKQKIEKVYLYKNFNDQSLVNEIKKLPVKIEWLNKKDLDHLCHENHQGIVLRVPEFSYCDSDEFTKKEDSLVVLLDHLEDPHNFGAIIRTAEAAGIKTIIIPKDRSVSVNDTVIKTSVGTTSNVKIVKVTNIAETIKKLQKEGYFVYGTSMDGKDCRDVDFSGKKVLIIGNEGKGISKIVEEKCDEIISIPMKGEVNSLNASVAAGILIFKMGGLS